jgi:hypothetical protein
MTTTELDPKVRHHPVVVDQIEKRAADVQLRIADRITGGSARDSIDR